MAVSLSECVESQSIPTHMDTQLYTSMHPFSPKLLSHSGHDTEQSSLLSGDLRTVGPCWLSTSNTAEGHT